MVDSSTIDNKKIPNYVTHVTQTLKNGGFEAFLVGGCVRDLILNKEPKDWDVTTNAKPEEIIALFTKTVYENTFGTVGVCVARETEIESYDIVEVTPYRNETTYSDFRHPDNVSFSEKIEDDLKRRDFTMNAIAYDHLDDKGQVVDHYQGQKDIKDKVIKTVGIADERFNEDALRMLRAIRFASQLDFMIEAETMQSIVRNAGFLEHISKERVRDEFIKIIESKNLSMGIGMLSKLGLLKYIIPELEEGIKCDQGGAHIYDVFEHCVLACQHAADKGFSTEIRIAALFHDIGKPRTRRPGVKKAYTFYGHEVVGARMSQKIMERLKFSRETTNLVVSMVRNHMFFSDTEQITLSAVRRIISKVGKDHIWELMDIRQCDRVGMKKVEAPYRLRKYHAMIEECLHDPISVGSLAIDGNYLINVLHMKPSRRMGWILHALLEEVIENPEKNNIEYLKDKVILLDILKDKDLEKIGVAGIEKKDELEKEEVEKLHKKHGVKK